MRIFQKSGPTELAYVNKSLIAIEPTKQPFYSQHVFALLDIHTMKNTVITAEKRKAHNPVKGFRLNKQERGGGKMMEQFRSLFSKFPSKEAEHQKNVICKCLPATPKVFLY